MIQQDPTPVFQPNFYPPPPPRFDGCDHAEVLPPAIACVICDQVGQVDNRSFKHSYVPPAAYIAVVLGPLLGLLLLVALRVQHDVTLPFCSECWSAARRANVFETLSALSFLVSIILGLILMLNFDSGYAFFLPVMLSIGLIVWSQVNKRKWLPKFKKADRKHVVVAAGRYGDIIFSKSTTATARPA